MINIDLKFILHKRKYTNIHEDVDDLDDLVGLNNITFKHDETPVSKKEIMRFKHDHTKEREISEMIYSNECIGKSVDKVIVFGQQLVKNAAKK